MCGFERYGERLLLGARAEGSLWREAGPAAYACLVGWVAADAAAPAAAHEVSCHALQALRGHPHGELPAGLRLHCGGGQAGRQPNDLRGGRQGVGARHCHDPERALCRVGREANGGLLSRSIGLPRSGTHWSMAAACSSSACCWALLDGTAAARRSRAMPLGSPPRQATRACPSRRRRRSGCSTGRREPAGRPSGPSGPGGFPAGCPAGAHLMRARRPSE